MADAVSLAREALSLGRQATPGPWFRGHFVEQRADVCEACSRGELLVRVEERDYGRFHVHASTRYCGTCVQPVSGVSQCEDDYDHAEHRAMGEDAALIAFAGTNLIILAQALLDAEVALAEIAGQEWVENYLDPQWAGRIAGAVLEGLRGQERGQG